MVDVTPKITKEQIVNGEKFIWKSYPKEETVLPVVTLTDVATGIELASAFSNKDRRIAAHNAWAGARHSRAPGTTPEIMKEMGEKGINPDEKLEQTFATYGHQSVADMARMTVHLNNLPMHMAMEIFNYGQVNSGQEKSSRFIRQLKGASLPDLKNYLVGMPQDMIERLNADYQALGDMANEIFNKHKILITEAYTAFFKPADKKEASSLDARVLDTIRFAIPFGQATGMAYEDSARNFSRLVSVLKAAPTAAYKKLGEQLEMFLAPSAEIEAEFDFKAEAPSLIRHTEAYNLPNENLKKLYEFLKSHRHLQNAENSPAFKGFNRQTAEIVPEKYNSARRMACQYILSVFPQHKPKDALMWTLNMDNQDMLEISKIIYSGHNKYNELPPQLSRTSDLTAICKTGLGEIRDFNRQRALGRFIQYPSPVLGKGYDARTSEALLSSGFSLPLYLSDIPEIKETAKNFESDLTKYYEKIFKFVELLGKEVGRDGDHSAVINIIPLAHSMYMWMHFDPKQASYMTHLRVRNGGHINYRESAAQINNMFADSDPFLSGIKFENTVNPADRKQFFDRS